MTTCDRCGARLHDDSSCPACLLDLAIDGATEASSREGATPPTLGTERIGAYRILEVLGEGGMGVVYLAEQSSPIRRRVALKLVRPGLESVQVMARFETERQALALMSHANVARVFDAGITDGGRPYFVMEHVPGIPIVEFSDRRKLAIDERLELFLQACDGLLHAHQKGIVHRDVKPSNLLVCLENDRPVVKVIDFGVAKATSQNLTERTLHTQRGIVLGTPEYMSPEQAGAGVSGVDTRSDIYSLGVVLYELLVGARPFDLRESRDAGDLEIFRIIREVEPPKLAVRIRGLGHSASEVARCRRTDPPSLARLLSGELEWIVLKALEKDPDRRYASAAELAADIRRFLDREPVLARPQTGWYRVRKFVQRHPLGVGSATLGVVLLAAFAGTMVVQSRRIAAERERALEALRYAKRMFEVSDPSEARGGEITARELLDKSAARIGQQLASSPRLHAEMADTIGSVYMNLGLYDRAEPLLATALDTRRRLLGAENEDTLRSLDHLGALRWYQGRLGEAESLWREALHGRRRVLGSDHPDTLESINNMGLPLRDQGRLSEAEGFFRAAVEGRRRVLGPDHPDMLSSLSNMAMLLELQGKTMEAEPYHREVLDGCRRVLGADHPETLLAIGNMGRLLRDQGKFREAEPYLRQAIDGSRRVLGNDHARTVSWINHLGILLVSEKRLEEAEACFREALEGSRRGLGPAHTYTAVFSASLASVLNKLGRFAEAEPLARQALEIFPKQLDPGHWRLAQARSILGESLAGLGRFAEAEPLLLDARQRLETATEAGRTNRRNAVERIVALYSAWGRESDAARWRRELSGLE